MSSPATPNISAPLRAACSCNALQYSLPPPTTAPLNSYICYCLVCRRVLSSLLAWQIWLPASSVKIRAGEDFISRYSRPQDLPDPKTGFRAATVFCRQCGGQVLIDCGEIVVLRGGALVLEGEGTEGLREWLEGDEGKATGWWPKKELWTCRQPGWWKAQVETAQQREQA